MQQINCAICKGLKVIDYSYKRHKFINVVCNLLGDTEL
jgi:hypothetical protein